MIRQIFASPHFNQTTILRLVEKAVQRLIDRCWFFDYDGMRYRFKTEPSLRKIVDDEMGLVGKIKAKGELDERIQKIWKKSVFAPDYFPSEAADVDDDAQLPKLVVLHYDAAKLKATEAAVPPDLVVKLFEHKGSMEEYRTYKNNLVFLIADEDQIDRMVDVAQQYLAIRRITGDPERIQEFNKAQADKLKQMGEAAELDLRVAITKCYRHMYYPSADAPKKTSNLAHQALQAEEQGKVQSDQTEVILKCIEEPGESSHCRRQAVECTVREGEGVADELGHGHHRRLAERVLQTARPENAARHQPAQEDHS